MDSAKLPFPPIELRRAVGPTDSYWYDNPTRKGALAELPGAPTFNYSRVLDFGCGCGRLARQMMQQNEPPRQYVGLDLNAAAIAWCNQYLAPYNPCFSFRHLDVENVQFNPNGSKQPLAFGVAEGRSTLVIAISVFTHILERDVTFYLRECADALEEGGLLFATWFVFDKTDFPVLQEFQNALYINLNDPTNAIWYDVGFIQRLYRATDMRICGIKPPPIRGFQYGLVARKGEPGEHCAFPADLAPRGLARPPQDRMTDEQTSQNFDELTRLDRD
jgi:SAM-dependent methyltransferase